MLIDDWIKQKIGLKKADILGRKALGDYQLFKLKETLAYAKNNSPFYKEHLKDINVTEDINSLADVSKISFTNPEMIKDHGKNMICVPQKDISRIVTLDTSGSTGDPKRIYFTESDQELTIDYFHYGMRVMTDSDDTFLVLLPCKTPGSVGDLLRMGLERDGVSVIPYGYPDPDGTDDYKILQIIKNENVTSLVGTPPAVARLVSKWAGDECTVRTVLLSAEYVSRQNIDIIERGWNCEVFEHFGMTETGLGGAMACGAHEGYHPREADLLFEVIDSKTGEVLPEGSFGELVFTTLTRTGMPLIRYRTGDWTRWLPEKCSCGSILKRLDRVGDRIDAKGY